MDDDELFLISIKWWALSDKNTCSPKRNWRRKGNKIRKGFLELQRWLIRCGMRGGPEEWGG